VIVLTGRAPGLDALDLDADDFLAGEPCDAAELLARIRWVLRRTRARSVERICSGPLQVDVARSHTTVAGRAVALTRTERALLVHFANASGRPLTRAHLLDNVIGGDDLDDHTIDVHVSRLRRKLGVAGRMIRTVYGVGYQFVPEEAPVRPKVRRFTARG